MLRKICVLLCSLLLLSAAGGQTLAEILRERAKSFPEVKMARTNAPFAAVHTLPGPVQSFEYKGRYYSACRFTTPEWLDGAVMWMFGHHGPDTDVTKGLLWYVIPQDPEDPDLELTRVKRWGGDARFPTFRELFPGFGTFHVQPLQKERLRPGKNYIIWFSFPQKERPEMRLALTVRSARGLREFGMLPTGNPHIGPGAAFVEGTPAKPKNPGRTANEAAAAFRKSGEAAAVAVLEKDLEAFIKTGSPFYDFYKALWMEAQIGSGRSELEWRAVSYGWLQKTCERLGAYTLSEDLVVNVAQAHGAVHAYGAAAESLVPFLRVMAERQIPLDPRGFPDAGPALESLPEIRHRRLPPYAVKSAVAIDIDGAIRSTRSLPSRFEGKLNTIAERDALAGEWELALERFFWASDWSELRRGDKDAFEIENGWYAARRGVAGLLQSLGLLEAAAVENEAILSKDWPDVYKNRSKQLARHRQLEIQVELGKADEAVLADLVEVHEAISKNPFIAREGWEDAEISVAVCEAALGRGGEADERLTRLVESGNHAARFERARLRLSAGKLDGLEDELIAVLRNFRSWGRKIDEFTVYSVYAQFLEKVGRTDESVATRREAIRLAKSFDLFAKLPVELARLSATLGSCGDTAGAARAAAEARRLAGRKDRIPARIASAVEEVLTARPYAVVARAGNKKKAVAELQPARVLIAPLAGKPARGCLLVTNPGTARINGSLTFEGLPVKTHTGEEEGLASVLVGVAGSNRLALSVEPGSYAMVEVSSGIPAPEGEL